MIVVSATTVLSPRYYVICIDLPHFTQIESHPAELWRHIDFYRSR